MLEDLNSYHVFYQVAKLKNMSQAARHLYITPVTVTRTVQNLEKKLGCKLLNRNSKGVTLTDEGLNLYEQIRYTFDTLDAAHEHITDTSGAKNRRLTIASSRTFTDYVLLNRCIKRLKDAFPDLQIVLKTTSESHMAEAISSGSVDFALGNVINVRSEKIATVPLFTDKVIAIVSADHAELKNSGNDITWLTKLPLISLPPDQSISTRAMLALRREGLEYTPSLIMDRIDRVITAVKYDLGYAFLPISCVLDAIHSGHIIPLDLELKGLGFVSVMYYDFQKLTSPAEKAFMQIMGEEAARLSKEIQNDI